MTPSRFTEPTSADAPVGIPRRRTVLTGAAWAVPAIVLTTSAPALAASTNVLTVSTPSLRVVADGSTTVTAMVKTTAGVGVAGQAVSFSGPSGSTFSPSSSTSNGSGTATTAFDLNAPWAVPGSTVSVTAISGGVSKSQALTVIGANAYGAGKNDTGQLGVGSYANQLSATQLGKVFPSPIVQLTAGSNFSIALLQDGSVWTVGQNGDGQLGLGNFTH